MGQINLDNCSPLAGLIVTGLILTVGRASAPASPDSSGSFDRAPAQTSPAALTEALPNTL